MSVISWYLSFPERNSVLPEAECYRPADLRTLGQSYLASFWRVPLVPVKLLAVFELSTCLYLLIDTKILCCWQEIAPGKQKACNLIFLSNSFLTICLWYIAVHGHIFRYTLVFQFTEISVFWVIHLFNKLCGKFERNSIEDFILKTFSILLLKYFFHLYYTRLVLLLCKSRILRKGHYYKMLLINYS